MDTGDRVTAWCRLMHAEACLSLNAVDDVAGIFIMLAHLSVVLPRRAPHLGIGGGHVHAAVPQVALPRRP